MNLLIQLSRSLCGSIPHCGVVVEPAIAVIDVQAIQPVPPISIRHATQRVLPKRTIETRKTINRTFSEKVILRKKARKAQTFGC